MEPKPTAPKTSQRQNKIKQCVQELAIALTFVLSVTLAEYLASGDDAGFIIKAFAALLPILALTGWWLFYLKTISRLDELGRAIETRSLAIACAVTIWMTTSWGLISVIVGAPALPLVMVAPLAAIIYGVIRAAILFRYR